MSYPLAGAIHSASRMASSANRMVDSARRIERSVSFIATAITSSNRRFATAGTLCETSEQNLWSMPHPCGVRQNTVNWNGKGEVGEFCPIFFAVIP